MSEAREKLQAAIKALGLTLRVEFVPWSKSRNAHQGTPSLNWRITVLRDGRSVLTTDYGAGVGHCPSHKYNDRSEIQRKLVTYECEHGVHARWSDTLNSVMFAGTVRRPILPDTCEVVSALVSDADVLNYPNFGEWAETFGYNPDSRAAESTYRACLETALALRNGVGEQGLRTLTEACQDY